MMMTQVKNDKIKILILQFKNNYYFYIRISIYNYIRFFNSFISYLLCNKLDNV
jgi:hypothetical protein